jgi:hypothetical protein
MRKLLLLAALAVLPLTAQAQMSLGLRLGYAPAGGNVGGDIAMSDWTVKNQIPLQLDLMFRVSPEVAVGGYFSYGLGTSGYAACDVSGVDCTASDLRLGLQATYSFTKASPQFVPWIGAGLGWEKASDSFEAGGTKVESSYSGIEFLNLQLGGDYKVNDQFSMGPYFMVSLGQFSSYEEGDVSGDIENTSMHQWYNFGIRGKFDL